MTRSWALSAQPVPSSLPPRMSRHLRARSCGVFIARLLFQWLKVRTPNPAIGPAVAAPVGRAARQSRLELTWLGACVREPRALPARVVRASEKLKRFAA